MVVLYTQDSCPQCRMVHMLIDKKPIEYKEEKDLEVMKSKGILHTPALEISVEVIKDDGSKITEQHILYGKDIFNYINGVK